MSISSNSNATTSSSVSPKSVIAHVSIATSPTLDKDQSIDDDEEDLTEDGVTIKIEHTKLDEESEHQCQNIVEQTRDSDDDSNVQHTNLTQCHIIQKTSNYNDNDQTSNESKSTASIIRVSPIQKSQLIKSASQSAASVVQIPGSAPKCSSGSNISTTATISTTTNSSNSSLPKVAPSSSSSTGTGSSSSSGNSSNNVSQNNLIKLSNTVVKLETPSPITCNILSKTAASNSKKSPLSRPDLVASSISTLYADLAPTSGAKTRPLLIDHNQYQQLQRDSNHLAATIDGKNVSLYKFDTSRSLATNVSSQLILSSIITSNPMQKGQQLGVGGGGSLDGLQFCLKAPSQQTISAQPTGRNLVEATQLTSTCVPTITKAKTITTANVSDTKPSSTTSSTSHSAPAETKTNSDAFQASARSKSKAHYLSAGSDCLQQANNSDNLTQSPGASGGTSGTGTNAAAARLIDLGKKLLDATRAGNVDQVRQLVVEAGAPFTSDWLGTTALHIAAQNGFTEIAEILIRGGVNRDARTKLERTALHLAAQSGSLEIVDSLITRGADVNGRDMLKMTPLHWAVERGHVCVVERLLIAGADFRMKSKFRLTPVDMAKNSGFYDILELFKTWSSGCKDEENLEAYRSLEASLDESQDFLDIDYHLALVDSATNSRGDSMLDNDEPCLDLVEFEWNKFDFEPELFLPNDGEDEAKVEYLTKIVEELQKENQQLRQQLRQRVEQLNDKPVI